MTNSEYINQLELDRAIIKDSYYETKDLPRKKKKQARKIINKHLNHVNSLINAAKINI